MVNNKWSKWCVHIITNKDIPTQYYCENIVFVTLLIIILFWIVITWYLTSCEKIVIIYYIRKRARLNVPCTFIYQYLKIMESKWWRISCHIKKIIIINKHQIKYEKIKVIHKCGGPNDILNTLLYFCGSHVKSKSIPSGVVNVAFLLK